MNRNWFKRMLQDGNVPSSSRVLLFGSTVMSWLWISYSLVRFHKWPDAVTFTGLATFCTAPYLVNRTTTAYENKDSAKTNQ